MKEDLSKLTKEELEKLKKKLTNRYDTTFTDDDQVKNLEVPERISKDADFSSYEGELNLNLPDSLPQTKEELEKMLQENEKREQNDILETDAKNSETHSQLHG